MFNTVKSQTEAIIPTGNHMDSGRKRKRRRSSGPVWLPLDYIHCVHLLFFFNPSFSQACQVCTATKTSVQTQSGHFESSFGFPDLFKNKSIFYCGNSHVKEEGPAGRHSEDWCHCSVWSLSLSFLGFLAVCKHWQHIALCHIFTLAILVVCCGIFDCTNSVNRW